MSASALSTQLSLLTHGTIASLSAKAMALDINSIHLIVPI